VTRVLGMTAEFAAGAFMRRNWLVVVFASSVVLSSASAIAQVSPVVPPAPVAPMAAPSSTSNVPPPAMAANPNNVADPMATKDLDQVICLNEKLTGSMLPTRVCQTRRNWIKQGVNSREVIEHAQNVGSGQPGGN
jgi:hypothetical protein